MWTMVAFTVPEDQRRLRPMLRGRLQSLGFAPLYDGLWVSPHAPDKELDIALEIAPAQVVHGDPGDGTADAQRLRGGVGVGSRRTRRLVRRVHPHVPADAAPTRARRDQSDRGLVSRTRANYRWFVFAVTDPDLPQALLPSRWPRAAAHDLFVALVDGMATLAVERVRDIVSKYDLSWEDSSNCAARNQLLDSMTSL